MQFGIHVPIPLIFLAVETVRVGNHVHGREKCQNHFGLFFQNSVLPFPHPQQLLEGVMYLLSENHWLAMVSLVEFHPSDTVQ